VTIQKHKRDQERERKETNSGGIALCLADSFLETEDFIFDSGEGVHFLADETFDSLEEFNVVPVLLFDRQEKRILKMITRDEREEWKEKVKRQTE
jgi:hypothetical protein